MDTAISLLVLSTLAHLAVPDASHETSFKAVAEIVSGHSRIFSGEGIRLKCSVPDVHKSTWDYLWFRGSERLPQRGEHLILWNSKVQESGKFYCQGVRDTIIGNIYTLKSLPLEIDIDGGWAILQVPPHPILIGDTLKVTCRIRGAPEINEIILYKDGIEVMRQNGLNPHFYLSNVTLWDQGIYSCRASADIDQRTHSVISVGTAVQVSEVLSQPILEIDVDNNLIPGNKIKLICHVQYNARDPAPPVHYYFYKNNNRLGTATSENHDLVKRTPGQYSCKAKVPELGITRMSEPKTFGQVTEPQTMMPPREPWPLVPQISYPDLALSHTAKPTAARRSPHRSTALPAFIQPTEASVQSSIPPLKPPQTVLSTVQTANPFDIDSEESGDMSGDSEDIDGESGDMFEESGDTDGESGDMFEESGDTDGESGDMFEESGGIDGESRDMFEESGDSDGESGDMFEESGDTDGESGDMFEESGDSDGELRDMFEESGDSDGESGDMFEESGDNDGESGDMFEESGEIDGESEDVFEESGDSDGESGDMFEESGEIDGESGDMFEESGDSDGESGDMFEESGDSDGESGDMFEESGDSDGESGDMFEESGDSDGESGDMFEESGDIDGESRDMFEKSGDSDGESGDMFEESGDIDGESGYMP